jgi:hypothetical protein
MLLLSLTFSQVFLGIASYAALAASANSPQPVPLTVWITVAHLAVGSLAFGAAVILWGRNLGLPNPLKPRMAAA